MMMKQLFRHTTSLLRTALLFGAAAFVNIQQTQAQTKLPDAFETIDPTQVDWSQEPYFYIQFNEGNVHSFLAEYGGNVMRGKDYTPYAKSMQWTLVNTGTTGKYYLKSKRGNYAAYDGSKYWRAYSESDRNGKSYYVFTLSKRSEGYYNIVVDGLIRHDDSKNRDYEQVLGRENGNEWGGIRGFDINSSRALVRFVRLKPNVAHIIYYRGEHADGQDHPANAPDATTTPHYLTYSGTNAALNGTDNWWPATVSSQKSIIPSNKSVWTLPTAAVYHKDGLWTLEETSTEGQFYIKKYGSSQYLNAEEKWSGVYFSVLGAQNSTYGKYVLETPDAYGRYTRIRNICPNWGYQRFLHKAQGDGWEVLQWVEDDNQANDYWYAGFLPVEVPASNQDDFYKVVLRTGDNMLSSDGTLKPYFAFNPDKWTLEQVDDYQHFRLKNLDGQYYVADGSLTSNASEAKWFTNEELSSSYAIEWLPNTETRVNHNITHKISNVRLYYQYNPTTPERQKVYGQQGLVTDADSEWKNEDGTQKVNEFIITHYVKKGQTLEFGLPTTLGSNNDHRLYQRWYNYNNDTDLDGLKNHFRLKTSVGEVMSYIYNNGIVTGEDLDWSLISQFPGSKKYESHLFTYCNSDGQRFTLAADVSRYNDFTYANTASHLDGDLNEPSLTMRYIYYMRDAKEMAKKLTANTEGSDNWIRDKIIHFPARRLSYDSNKRAEYQGEFIGIYHTFRDYWVFNTGNPNDTNDDHLVNADNVNGKIEVEIEDPNGTGITLGGKDNKGYYLYDEGKPGANKTYGDSRYVAFKYPGETVNATGKNNPAYLKVYFNYGDTRYQIEKYTIYFDDDTSTLPWTDANSSNPQVKNSKRDPNKLREVAGKPIAKITFDYPAGANYKTSAEHTIHNNGSLNNWWQEIPNSSPLPLTFENTNYGFDGDNCSWGSYALVTQTGTPYGNHKTVLPASDGEHGYNIRPDAGMNSAFLYIDASEQPGDICSIDFTGEFCANDVLMCSGWISGANAISDAERCPGSVTITVKGERMESGEKKEYDIYRFCPGQCYELDNGDYVNWQQFYFEFSIEKKYDRHWIEVNNNCVSSTGGDFMLDNIEVYAMVPEVKPEMNTPVCLDKNGKTDMRLLKLTLGYDKLVKATGTNESAPENSNLPLGVVFLKKDVFLKKFQEGLKTYNSIIISMEDMEKNIEDGVYKEVTSTYKNAYEYAFNAALLGTKSIWDANNSSDNEGAGILNFRWNNKFDNIEKYVFAKAVNNTKTIYGYTDPETKERFLVMNGNYPKLKWQTNTDYYIVLNINGISNIDDLYTNFNICSDCNRYDVFQIDPPYTILSMESSDVTQELVVCEGKVPTVLTDLKGYDVYGKEAPMKDLNFDWWLGNNDKSYPENLATLENYHNQKNSAETVRLDEALSYLRAYYPGVTSLDGLMAKTSNTPYLTADMIAYLQELVDKGQLVLHQKSVSIPAEKAHTTDPVDPYFYLVACPIHDEKFKQALDSKGMYSLITNGSMEGIEDRNFYMCDPNTAGKQPAALVSGVGKNDTRGVSITSGATSNNYEWDTQFFICSDEVIPIGTTFHLEFDYKASETTTIHTQSHTKPGEWIASTCIGDVVPTSEWQHFKKDIEVTTDMGGSNNNFKSIAFNLWTGSPITYQFDNVVLTVHKEFDVAYFCDEPQGLRMKVGEKAPTLKCGFVPNENGFTEYNYPTDSDPVLSIRLAKAAQFETVKNDADEATTVSTTVNYLWLPIRNAETETATGVIQKSDDDNIYLASTNDSVWNKNIYKSMSATVPSLPVVGRIVKLNATNTKNDATVDQRGNRLCVYFTNNFEVREGYNYTLSLPFKEVGDVNTCDGTLLINLKIVPDYEVWTGGADNTDWNNDENWRRADGNTTNSSGVNGDELYVKEAANDSPLKGYKTNAENYRSSKDRVFRKGFAPLYCTHILMKTDEWGDAPVLYDALDDETTANNHALTNSPFPNLRDKDNWDGNGTKATATSILRYDMQARSYKLWNETYGSYPDKGERAQDGDLYAEMYQVNSCDEIAFQPGTELRNAHLLNYNSAWVEYELDNKRWYLLGSPLQGTISGEWYAPTGTAQQKTTYYDNVTFGTGYDRYAPAIYQRSWDKAKAVLYEVGANYDKTDDAQNNNNDIANQGSWGSTWQTPTGGADDYLDRLGYKPFGAKKANVAIQGIWSNTYNDAQVDYGNGGFSVMVMNHLKSNDTSGGKSVIRLPKEDTEYEYWDYGKNEHGTNTELSTVRTKDRAKNRGRLKTDLLLPTSTQKTEATASRYGDHRTYTRVPTKVGDGGLPMTLRSFAETVPAGESKLGFFLVENPFPCGLNMDAFFAGNSGLNKKYWLLTATGQQLVQQVADDDWINQSGSNFTTANNVLAPGQGFFVQATSGENDLTVTFSKDMQVQSRYGVKSNTGRTYTVVVGTEQVMEDKTIEFDEDGDGTVDYTETIQVPKVDGTGNYVVKYIEDEVVIYNYDQTTNDDYKYPLKARTRGEDANLVGLVITAQRGNDLSSALVMQRDGASNDFLPEEDTEVFINSDLVNAPTVYTLCGRLATTINSIHDFRSLPIGVESSSDAPCTLTFNGVELLGDSISFYDAVEQKLTPLKSGMQFAVSGQTQNRYYLVRSLNPKEAAEETHLQIFTKGTVATVVASTQEPLTIVRCFDAAGRLVYSASPQTAEHSFDLPDNGVYIIEAQTENDRKTKKVMTK